ncbi:MAG: aldolase/citrate lyase family protein [Actinomycetota bacterium]
MSATVTTSLRRRLDAGETLVGPSVMTGSAAMVEICIFAGFDWVMLDVEHGPTGIDMDLENLVRATAAIGAPAGVRVPDRSGAGIGKALDFGAEVIWVPQVGTPAEARACRLREVLAGRHAASVAAPAPATARPLDGVPRPCRPRDLARRPARDRRGRRNAAEIAAVDGIDAICLGPTDYATDIGLSTKEFVGPDTPGPRHPAIAEALEQVLGAARANDLVPCAYAYDQAWLEHLLGEGCRFILYGTDVSLVRPGLEEVTAGIGEAKANIGAPAS